MAIDAPRHRELRRPIAAPDLGTDLTAMDGYS